MITNYNTYIKENKENDFDMFLSKCLHNIYIDLYNNNFKISYMVLPTNVLAGFNLTISIYHTLNKYIYDYESNVLKLNYLNHSVDELDNKSYSIIYLIFLNMKDKKNYNITTTTERLNNNLSLSVYTTFNQFFVDINQFLSKYLYYYNNADIFVKKCLDDSKDINNKHLINLLQYCNEETKELYNSYKNASNFDLI
jgi:hypothetical protein